MGFIMIFFFSSSNEKLGSIMYVFSSNFDTYIFTEQTELRLNLKYISHT